MKAGRGVADSGAHDLRNGHTYQFNIDEQNGLLMLFGKNKLLLEVSLVYRRGNEDDQRRGANAARDRSFAVLRKFRPEPDSGLPGSAVDALDQRPLTDDAAGAMRGI